MNGDDFKVFYRDEKGGAGFDKYINSCKYIKEPVDGIATSKHTAMIYKIPDGARAHVHRGGEVTLNNINYKSIWAMDKYYQFKFGIPYK